MKNIFGVLFLLQLSTFAYAADFVRDLPFWTIDLSAARCKFVDGPSRIFFDGTQDKWIRSEQLTRLMKISAMKAHYKIEIAGAVFVNTRGNMVFLGYQNLPHSRTLMLNTFAFGAFRQNLGDQLDLLAQHAVVIQDGRIHWPDQADECFFSL